MSIAEDGLLEMRAEGDTLSVAGDVDLHQARTFQERAERHIQEVEQPRLDMSGVAFLDSAGLAALLTLSRQAKAEKKTLRVVVTGSPRRVLRITGIDQVLLIED